MSSFPCFWEGVGDKTLSDPNIPILQDLPRVVGWHRLETNFLVDVKGNFTYKYLGDIFGFVQQADYVSWDFSKETWSVIYFTYNGGDVRNNPSCEYDFSVRN